MFRHISYLGFCLIFNQMLLAAAVNANVEECVESKMAAIVADPLRHEASKTSKQIRTFAGQYKDALQRTSKLDDGIDTKKVAINYVTTVVDQADQAICEAVYDVSREDIKTRFERILLQFKIRITNRVFRAGLFYRKPVLPLLVEAPPPDEKKSSWSNPLNGFISWTRGNKAKDTDQINVQLISDGNVILTEHCKMEHAWKMLHKYVFDDLNEQLEFLVPQALPQLIAHNNSLTIFEKRYFIMDLSGARKKLTECFKHFKSDIFGRFTTIDDEESTKDSFVVLDYLSNTRAKYEAIDWSTFCTNQIFRIEQIYYNAFEPHFYLERILKIHLERRFTLNEDFPAIDWKITFTVFATVLGDIKKLYQRKIDRVNVASRKAKATDLNKALHSENLHSLRDTINKHRLTINSKISYYLTQRSSALATNNVSAGDSSSVILVSKISKDIYAELREIVFFTETISQILYNLGKRGYFNDLLKDFKYPVTVFPHMVGMVYRKRVTKSGRELKRNSVLDILNHYNEVEQRYMEKAMLHIRNIVTYIKGATQFLEEHTKKSQSTSAELRVHFAPITRMSKHAENSSAAADEEMSDSNEFTWTKVGPQRLKNIENNEPSDEEVDRSFAEARRIMMKGEEPLEHAFSDDIETELYKDIEQNREVLLKSLPKPEDSLESPVQTTEEIQDKYDEYIIKVNKMFARYMDVILKYLSDNKIIKDPHG